jgi:hypothetical protein
MPGLAAIIDSLDKVAEPLRWFYESKEGKFHLILDGAPVGFVPAAELANANNKVVEFRDKNVALLKEVDELKPLKTKYDGVDPEVAKADRARVLEFEKKGMKGADDLDQKFKTMLADAIKPISEALALSKNETLAERKRADESTLRQVIGNAFAKAGGKPKALDYAISQAEAVFEVKEGKVTAKGKFSTLHPGDPLGVEEWLGAMAKENDFAFEPSKGSGAAQSSGGGAGNVTLKPGQTLLKDPTPQQLGEFSRSILKGTTKLDYTDNQV